MKQSAAHLLRSAVQSCKQQEAESILLSLNMRKKESLKEKTALHEALLFCLAYPPSERAYALAQKLLSEINVEQDESGIRGGTVISCYTLALTKWMLQQFPGAITFHSFDEEKTDVGELMKLMLPSAESEALMSGWTKNKLFKKLCGGKITAEKMVSLFAASADEKLNEFIFSQLKMYVQIVFAPPVISRSNARSIAYPVFFHSEILKKPDTEKIIASPLPKAMKLQEQERKLLSAHARMQLAAMGRETDPVTFSEDEETEFFVLDRGFSIALFTMKAENRLAFDSYIGYMMYKNGLPIAYGGAWIFFHRALIGINIFDAYRGGESSVVFAQLLRVYHQRYSVKRFSVEPYQYGKNNPEGIASGAYWFYYRFGFRSDDEKLRKLAAEESEKIKNSPSYRSSGETLKKFTQCNITLFLNENDESPDPSALSLGITHMIAEKFSGNRKQALKAATNNFYALFGKKSFNAKTSAEKMVFENWSLALLCVLTRHVASDNTKQKNNFIAALKAKANGAEAQYIALLQKAFVLTRHVASKTPQTGPQK